MGNVIPASEKTLLEDKPEKAMGFFRRHWLLILCSAGILFLVFFNLTSYPLTWFDEGSHLHVPKTLIRFGVYADYSSEGYRYYGPTIGVGPTVFLPIAFIFKLFGMGLFQARLVIAIYLLATIFVFYKFSRNLGGAVLAGVATAIVVASRGVNILEYGREVLGEVPGFFFMILGLLLWFSAWEKPTWKNLSIAGLILGLSLVTKNQYLIVLGPGLGLAFLANLIYYKSAPQRVFIITGIVTVATYLLWEVCAIFLLGPASAVDNFALLRQATADSALIFSTALMKLAISNLLDIKVYFGLLFPGIVYGLLLSLPRKREGLKWGVIFFMVLSNLAWYVLASISWLRYAFPALAFSGIFIGKLFLDLIGEFHLDLKKFRLDLQKGEGLTTKLALRGVLIVWLIALFIIPTAQNVYEIVKPEFNGPVAMAAYLDKNVSKNALIETWEPEMGFLTDHNYHFPPPALLYVANNYIWLGKASPSLQYNFVQTNRPDYVLVGVFSSWVQLYPTDFLSSHYKLETEIGNYKLYAIK